MSTNLGLQSSTHLGTIVLEVLVVPSKKVSLRELKQNLSKYVRLVSDGHLIEITKFNRPIAILAQPLSHHLHIGKRVGSATIEGVVSKSVRDKALKFLIEDRNE